jgi:hypothetical protein
VAPTLVDAAAAVVAAGPQATEALLAGDETLARDLGQAHSRACAEAFGLDWGEVNELASKFIDEITETVRVTTTAGLNPKVAYDSAIYSGLIAAVLATASVVSGVEPVGDVDAFTQHPEVPSGGWICGHGHMCTVLGVDAEGQVAFRMEDGELVPNYRRPSVEAFLAHHTRVDDVPVLGGGEA